MYFYSLRLRAPTTALEYRFLLGCTDVFVSAPRLQWDIMGFVDFLHRLITFHGVEYLVIMGAGF